MQDVKKSEPSGATMAFIGIAIAAGTALPGAAIAICMPRIQAVFEDWGHKLPALTVSLLDIGSLPIAATIVILFLWPIAAWLAARKMNRPLALIILLNSVLVAVISVSVAIGLLMPFYARSFDQL